MDFLKPILGDDLFKQVQDKLKDTELKLADLSTGEYVGKAKFLKEETKANSLIQDIAKRDQQLEDLKGKSGDAEALQVTITELQTANATEKTNYETQLAETNLKYAVGLAITKARPKDENASTAITSLVKMGAVTLGEDGKLLGLSEQLETLKTESAYLFEGKQSSGNGDGGNPADDADTDEVIEDELVDKFTKAAMGQTIGE